MSDYLIKEETLINIADAIRSKTNSSGKINPEDMDNSINNIITLSSGTSDANAASSDILANKTAYVNGSKITGTIPSLAAQTITPGTSNKTINAGQYLSGVQTIKGDANLIAANILSGKSIFGVNGNVVQTNIVTGTVTPTDNYNMTITGAKGKNNIVLIAMNENNGVGLCTGSSTHVVYADNIITSLTYINNTMTVMYSNGRAANKNGIVDASVVLNKNTGNAETGVTFTSSTGKLTSTSYHILHYGTYFYIAW